MPLDSLDIHVLLWLQTPSSVNGLWAMTVQELAASDIASVHCKPNQLQKNQTENGSFFKYVSLGQKPRPSSKCSSLLKWFLIYMKKFKMYTLFSLTTINLFFPGFLNIYPRNPWGSHAVREVRGKMTCAQGQSKPEVSRILVCCLSFKSSYLGGCVTEKHIQDILQVEYTSFYPQKLKRLLCQMDSYSISLNK